MSWPLIQRQFLQNTVNQEMEVSGVSFLFVQNNGSSWYGIVILPALFPCKSMNIVENI